MTDETTGLVRRRFLKTAAAATAAAALPAKSAQAATSAPLTNEEYIALAKNFLMTRDARGDTLSLMTDDIEFVVPKYGVVRGKANLGPYFRAWASYVKAMRHPPETFKYLVGDRRVAIEGLSQGTLQDGKTWTAAPFCVIYDFEGRLVKRAAIYTDPDYCDETAGYYPWRHG